MGGGQMLFPTTRWSAIAGARSADAAERARSLEALAAAYWRPIYKYVRLKWRRGPADAEDLTQGFFARAIENEWFRPFDPAKARFRTFLRACLDGHVANEAKALGRQKRGGNEVVLSLDFAAAEDELSRSPAPPELDRYFDEEWARCLFSLAVEALRAELEGAGKAAHFRAFERYDLADSGEARPTYAALAAESGIKVTDVTNHLAFARRRMRALVLEKLRELTATDEEFEAEARLLMGSGR